MVAMCNSYLELSDFCGGGVQTGGGGGEPALNLSPKFVFMWLLICEWYVKKSKGGMRKDLDWGWVDG